jgi:hypothetical protein
MTVKHDNNFGTEGVHRDICLCRHYNSLPNWNTVRCLGWIYTKWLPEFFWVHKFLACWHETFAHEILACVKKRGSSEVVLAAQALGQFLCLIQLTFKFWTLNFEQLMKMITFISDNDINTASRSGGLTITKQVGSKQMPNFLSAIFPIDSKQ